MKESQRERSRQSKWHLQKPSGRLEVGTPETRRKASLVGFVEGEEAGCQCQAMHRLSSPAEQGTLLELCSVMSLFPLLSKKG